MNFFRKTVLFLVALSIFAACGSFISQYILGMNPCVLCILQRLCVLAVGLLAIVTAFSSQSSKFARSLSALFIAAPAVYGTGVAAYQIWLQSLPPGTAPSCGAPWTFRLRAGLCSIGLNPSSAAFGNCAEPDYLFGVALPVWSILYFSFVVLLLLWAWLKTRKI